MSVIVIVIHKSLAVIFYLLSAVDWITVNSNTLSTSIFHYTIQTSVNFRNFAGAVVSTDFPLFQKLNPFITASADGFTLVKYVLLLLLILLILLLIIIIIDRELYAQKT